MEIVTPDTWDKEEIINFLQKKALLKNSFEAAFRHSVTVAKVSSLLGRLLHMPAEELDLLERAALVHDADKRFAVRGTKVGIFGNRFDAEQRGEIWLDRKGVPKELLNVTKVTSPNSLSLYLQGDFQGEEHLLSRVLFFADEIVQQDQVVHWKERIEAWTDEELKAPQEEYGGRSQQEVELQWAEEIERELKKRLNLDESDDLIEFIQGHLFD